MEEGGYAFEVNNGRPTASEFGTTARISSPSLTMSSSFREGGGGGGSKGLTRRRSMKPSFDADNEFITLLHGSDPVKVELNRLENDVRDKDRELSESQAEIKALRLSERQREKAVEEVSVISALNLSFSLHFTMSCKGCLD
jgi:hypothetical protein